LTDWDITSAWSTLGVFIIGAWAGRANEEGAVVAALVMSGIAGAAVNAASSIMGDFKTAYYTLAHPRALLCTQVSLPSTQTAFAFTQTGFPFTQTAFPFAQSAVPFTKKCFLLHRKCPYHTECLRLHTHCFCLHKKCCPLCAILQVRHVNITAAPSSEIGGCHMQGNWP